MVQCSGVSPTGRSETERSGARTGYGVERPQPLEPPYTDPYVRWCGRGLAGITGYPLSRLQSFMSFAKAGLSCDVGKLPLLHLHVTRVRGR